jgi:hypothetical protein
LIHWIKIDDRSSIEEIIGAMVKEICMRADQTETAGVPLRDCPASHALTAKIWETLELPASALDRLTIAGAGALPSAFPVTELAIASIAAAALAVSELVGLVGEAPGARAPVIVDRRLASLWFGWSVRPAGWELPPAWDPIAGDYRTADSWIRLHTNAPRHRAAALAVLGCKEDRAAVAAAVERCTADDLEQAVVNAGGCAAAMHTIEQWARHPQGIAVATEPLISFTRAVGKQTGSWRPLPGRPLSGLKVLDLTRILAGPVATRLLAGYGADVLRIDPPKWDEPSLAPEITLGKRCARLDLRIAADRATFENLLRQTDVLVHGYRPGALDALGYDETRRRVIRPGLIEVTLDAYGWSGPWRMRRGFDSLVQMSTGIAAAGMAWRRTDRPTPLPVQALDQATGHLMAASVIRGLIDRVRSDAGMTARVSLARTSSLLGKPFSDPGSVTFEPPTAKDYAPGEEVTNWGPARRLVAPATVENNPLRWDRGALALGSAVPTWAVR